MDAVVVFTTYYPDVKSMEASFIVHELQALSRHFARVIVVPFRLRESDEPLGEDFQVDDSLSMLFFPRSLRFRARALLAALRTSRVRDELRKDRRALMRTAPLKRFAAAATISEHVRRWVVRFVEERAIDVERSVFYTYWCNEITLGVGLSKAVTGLRLVSRAHGGDVLHEQHAMRYLPFQEATLDLVDIVFCAGEHIRGYIIERYPHLSPRTRVSYLGTADPEARSGCSVDGKFRVVSCAHVTPVKRVDLMIEALSLFSRQLPELAVEWTHFGGGPLLGKMSRLAASRLPNSVRWSFRGSVSNAEVQRFYEGNPVDLFVNTSYSEGLPVSIMEALSFGVPVMAPAVSGIPEAVGENAGFLFPRDADAAELAGTLLGIARAGGPSMEMRGEARRNWEQRFRAAVNYRRFAEALAEIAGPD